MSNSNYVLNIKSLKIDFRAFFRKGIKLNKKIIDDEILNYLEKIDKTDKNIIAKAVNDTLEKMLEQKLTDMGELIATEIQNKKRDNKQKLINKVLKHKKIEDNNSTTFVNIQKDELITKIIKSDNIAKPIIEQYKNIFNNHYKNKIVITYLDYIQKNINEKAYIEDIFSINIL